MTKAEARTLQRIADDIAHVAPRGAAQLRALAPKRRPSLPRHSAVAKAEARRQQKKESRRERVAAIREAVFARAGGQCEAWHESQMVPGVWLRCQGQPTAMDHWRGGRGRRRAEESEATCWALCSIDDAMRTMNRPSSAYWNESHKHHCKTHGYRFTPHYDARAAARSGAEGERDPKENGR